MLSFYLRNEQLWQALIKKLWIVCNHRTSIADGTHHFCRISTKASEIVQRPDLLPRNPCPSDLRAILKNIERYFLTIQPDELLNDLFLKILHITILREIL